MAWLSGYTTRRRIVISHANVDADLTAFPVYVRLRSTNFNFAESTANGHDVRFTAADGVTLLSFERERHDQGAALADYIVRIPTLFGAVDTEIFVYFRTTSNTDLSAPNAVWDSNTVGRWSLSENPAGTAPQMRDSTANNNHGTTEGAMALGQSVEGQVGRALSFDGVNDRVNIPDTAKGGASVTASGFIRLSTLTHQHIYTESDMNSMALAVNAGGSLVLLNETTTTVHASFSSTPGLISIGAWFHVTYSFNHITGRLEGYINGNRVIDVHRGGNQRYWNRSNNVIGVYLSQNLVTTDAHLRGQIDEVSISNIARSPAWIKASFHSGNNTLLTVEATEVAAFVHVGLSPIITQPSFVKALSQNITGLLPITSVSSVPYLQGLNYLGTPSITPVMSSVNIFQYSIDGLTTLEAAPSHVLIASLPNVYEYFSHLFVTGHLSGIPQILYDYDAGQFPVFVAPVAERVFHHKVIGDSVFIIDFSGEVIISRLEANEFRFAGVPSRQYHVKMLKSPISVLPGTRDKIITIPGRHGALRMPHDWQERTLQLECWLAASSMTELHDRLDAIRAWLGQGQQKLIVGYRPDRFYIATFAGGALETEIKAHQGLFSLEFVCAEPFAYDIVPDVVTITTASHQHNQRGTAPAKPLLVLRGNILSGQQISISIGARTVVYTGVLATNERLEIDCDTMSVFRVLGTLRTNTISQITTTTFPVLTPGINAITVSTANGAIFTSLEVQCRNRWL